MKKAVEVTDTCGIRCDACDWKNPNIKVEDCESWLNKPCPKCGANLLTETDLKILKFLLSLTDVINDSTPLFSDDEPTVGLRIETNGTDQTIFHEWANKETE